MSWLSKATGIHISPHGAHVDLGELKSGLGNLAKNLSPALAFTPVGLVGTALASGAGDLLRGKNIGEAAVGAAKNAAIGGTARAASGLIQNAISHGAGSGIPGSTIYSQSPSGGYINAATGAPVTAATPLQGAGVNLPSFGLKDAISKGAGFIEKHPTATAMGLQAVGNLASSGAQNRLLNQQADEAAYDFDKRKQRDMELAPAFASLGQTLGQSLGRPLTPSPYAQRYGG